MSRYVEKHLYENELIVEKAKRDAWGLVGWWIFGILCCWMLLIPTVLAIKETIIFTHTELVLTNKRIIRKSGVFHTKAFDAPLDKILNVYVETTFWGLVFNTNRIRIATEDGIIVDKLANAGDFKAMILGQIDHFQEARLAMQASWTAQAMLRNSQRQPQGYGYGYGYPNEQQGRGRRRDDDAYDDYGYDL